MTTAVAKKKKENNVWAYNITYKNEWVLGGLGFWVIGGFCLFVYVHAVVKNRHHCFICLSPGTNYQSSKYEATRGKKVVGVFCLKFYWFVLNDKNQGQSGQKKKKKGVGGRWDVQLSSELNLSNRRRNINFLLHCFLLDFSYDWRSSWY